jgi:preprotein translocase subunit YajC
MLKRTFVALSLFGSLFGGSVFAADTTPTAPLMTSISVNQPQPSLLSNFLPLVIIVVIVIFFFWSQRRKTAQVNKMLSALTAGDEVSLASGFMGKIVKVNDQSVTVEIADGVNVKVQKQAILQVLPKGTLSGL